MVTSTEKKARGLLNPQIGQQKFQLTLHLPPQDLAFFIEHYWIVRWDLRGQPPYLAENLPHPTVHLVFEQKKSRIVGVTSGKFSHLLEGKGGVFGIKFRPGAFYPFVRFPISSITDREIRLWDMFGVESEVLEEVILSQEDDREMIKLAEAFLRERLPEQDANVGLINQIVDCIIADRRIVKVDDVTRRFPIGKRTLQRLFSQYVGVSPKWVIKRYRLHEAAEQLASGNVPDWPKIALELGYFDQAHFIKDFRAIVGTTPAEYVKQTASVR